MSLLSHLFVFTQGSHPREEMRHNRKPTNNVRFASPTYIQQQQESQLTSSLYDSQNTDHPDNTYYDQSSFPHSSGRFTTLDWDSFHRDSSANCYHFGQVPSMRTPHSHFQPRNDYMRFSTPYNPCHRGMFDPRSSLNHSYDMYGDMRDYGSRGPNMGSPIRYPGPGRPVDGYQRPPYVDDTHFRPGREQSNILYRYDEPIMGICSINSLGFHRYS